MKYLPTCTYLPTCNSRLVVQHSCQVSLKSMQGFRRSWEDKLKCVKILSVKDHYSAKICWTWIISPHALLDLWPNIPSKFHWNPCKDVGGVEKTNFDGMEWRKDRMTEGRTKQTLNAPLPFYGGGIKKRIRLLQCTIAVMSNWPAWSTHMQTLMMYRHIAQIAACNYFSSNTDKHCQSEHKEGVIHGLS